MQKKTSGNQSRQPDAAGLTPGRRLVLQPDVPGPACPGRVVEPRRMGGRGKPQRGATFIARETQHPPQAPLGAACLAVSIWILPRGGARPFQAAAMCEPSKGIVLSETDNCSADAAARKGRAPGRTARWQSGGIQMLPYGEFPIRMLMGTSVLWGHGGRNAHCFGVFRRRMSP